MKEKIEKYFAFQHPECTVQEVFSLPHHETAQCVYISGVGLVWYRIEATQSDPAYLLSHQVARLPIPRFGGGGKIHMGHSHSVKGSEMQIRD